MIYAFTGKTGSGKTFAMVGFAYQKWLKGTDIYSNTWLNFEKYGGQQGKEVKNWAYKAKKIINPRSIPKKRGKIYYFEDITELITINDGLILIDEAQVLFNARNWESLPYIFQYKLQQHRKHKLDLYCTTQNMGTIDISYRRLVQKWYHYTDIFALFWKRNPSFLTIHKQEEKDIDKLFNQVDDLAVESVKNHYFIITKLRKRLYDTMYDIGFRALKLVCEYSKNITTNKTQKIWWIIPKQMTLNEGKKLGSSLYSKYSQKG